MEHTNRLINEQSPYLLQHARNPVDWFPWCDEAFEKARNEDKLVLVSIGYSACHWCHVMERESFENEKVAEVMNRYFVCIKVDREERPDVDQVYMNAVQLMSGQGGWPLNCFTLPDRRPVYGGTYFNTGQWMNILHNLHAVYRDEKQKVTEYAEKLTSGICADELVREEKTGEFSEEKIKNAVHELSLSFDSKEGGMSRAPKFPMPCLWKFFLHYGHFYRDENILGQVKLTLDKMARGGIYDQAGGGFARYSVDMLWKVPHFEKMLYDNAQLVSLYSEAYRKFKNDEYKNTVYQTLEFIERELANGEGGYYCALDADSDGTEGKYYVWTKEELQKIAGDDLGWIKEYYSVDEQGEWEEGNYILLRKLSNTDFSREKGWTEEKLEQKIKSVNKKLLESRSKRIRPGLDDKTLASWNGMMIKGLAEAYKSFGEKEFLNRAKKCALFIESRMMNEDGSLFHSYKNGKAKITGFLEDYAFVADAFNALYEITGDKARLDHSCKLLEYAITHFFDGESGMFFFTHFSSHDLVARKTELYDNVIPSSNSVMAGVAGFLGKVLMDEKYTGLSERMLKNMAGFTTGHLSSFSNWAYLYLQRINPVYEIVVCGENAEELSQRMFAEFVPASCFSFSVTESSLPLLTSRLKTGKTLIYICKNNSCNLPVESVEEAMKQWS